MTVANLLGVNPWLIVVPLTVLAAVWFWRSGRSGYHSGGWVELTHFGGHLNA